MATRLTNEIRDSILGSALAATTFDKQAAEITKDAIALCRDYVIGCQPKAWSGIIKGHPRQWFMQQAHLSMPEASNPVALLHHAKIAYEHPNDRRRFYHVTFNDPVCIAVEISGKEHEANAVKFLANLVESAEALAAGYTEARRAVRALLLSRSTVERLIADAPELAPHVPKIARASYALVAPSNALSMLARMGFDQTAKQPRKGA